MIKPPAPVLSSIVEESSNMYCFESFSKSAPLLNAVMYMAQTYRDVMVDGMPGTSFQAQAYLASALQSLRELLAASKQSVPSVAISVIASLAMTALFTGDVEAAAHHMNGLRAICYTDQRPNDSSWEGTLLDQKAKRSEISKPSIDFAQAMAC